MADIPSAINHFLLLDKQFDGLLKVEIPSKWSMISGGSEGGRGLSTPTSGAVVVSY